jgi:hypothetical protein
VIECNSNPEKTLLVNSIRTKRNNMQKQKIGSTEWAEHEVADYNWTGINTKKIMHGNCINTTKSNA